jgi:hypothetical protein
LLTALKIHDLRSLYCRWGRVSAEAATPAQAHFGITGSEFVVLPGRSRMAQAERPGLTLGLIRGWLVGVEASLRG